MHIEDNAASEQGADRAGIINERRGEEERSEKGGRKSDARQSGAGMYYSARGVSHFYRYSLDLTSPGIKVTLPPAYRRFASVRPEETILCFSLDELQFVANIWRNFAVVKA